MIIPPKKPEMRILCVDDSSYNLFLMKELFNTIDNVQIKLDTAMHGMQALSVV